MSICLYCGVTLEVSLDGISSACLPEALTQALYVGDDHLTYAGFSFGGGPPIFPLGLCIPWCVVVLQVIVVVVLPVAVNIFILNLGNSPCRIFTPDQSPLR